MQMFWVLLVWTIWSSADGHRSLPLYKEAIRSIHPLCSPRSTPTCHFDVMARTYEPIGLIPTREPSVLFEIILHQALKQTGETTRACRFCLQVLNFLQTEGRSAFMEILWISETNDLYPATTNPCCCARLPYIRHQGFAGIRDKLLSRIHRRWQRVDSTMLEHRKACGY